MAGIHPQTFHESAIIAGAGDVPIEGFGNRVDADMAHVLETLSRLGARPVEHGMPAWARSQPGFADAVRDIVAKQQRAPQDDGVAVEDIVIDGSDTELGARLYRPMGLLSRLNPVVLYFHGGGFVTGDLDSHDASARALARRSGALVVSLNYRLAPEHRFPAAHEDGWAAWKWLAGQSSSLGIDTRRMAVAGEDGGANLAFNTALRARDEHYVRPVHQLLIHPIAGADMSTASYSETVRTRPIGMPAMRWRFRHLVESENGLEDGRIDLLGRANLAGVAPASIILAGIDPLRSEGEALAERLEAAHVPVSCWTYEGVTQGFFGLGALVTKALFAQADAADALAQAFGPDRRS